MGRLLLLFVVGGIGIVIWLVAMVAKGVVHVGEKTTDIFRSGREKIMREYGGKLRFTLEYERLLAFSLFSVMQADGKTSQFEIGTIRFMMSLYREIVGQSLSEENAADQTKAILREVASKRGDELVAAAMPMLMHEKAFLIECVMQVAKWEGIHRNEQIFIQHLANEIGINLPSDIFEKAHKSGMEITAKIRESNPELQDD